MKKVLHKNPKVKAIHKDDATPICDKISNWDTTLFLFLLLNYSFGVMHKNIRNTLLKNLSNP